MVLPLQPVNIPGGFVGIWQQESTEVYEQSRFSACLPLASLFFHAYASFFSPTPFSYSSLPICYYSYCFPHLLPQFFPHPLHHPRGSSPPLAPFFHPPPPKLFLGSPSASLYLYASWGFTHESWIAKAGCCFTPVHGCFFVPFSLLHILQTPSFFTNSSILKAIPFHWLFHCLMIWIFTSS